MAPSPARLCLVLLLVGPCALGGGTGCTTSRAVDAMRDGILAQREGKQDRAIERYRTALRLEPTTRGAYYNLGLLAEARQRPDQAEALAEQELELHPGADDARGLAAVAALRQERPTEAMEHLATASAAPHAALLTGLARWRGGEPHERVVEALAGLDDTPAAGVVRRWSAAAASDLDALAALDRGDGDVPAETRRAAAHARATLAAREGAWDRTLEQLDAAIAAAPTPDLWVDRAIALVHLGRDADARLAVAGVLRDAPDHARARQLLELLGP